MDIVMLEQRLQEEFPKLKLISADINKFVFEQRVKLMCFYCGKYGKNWRCPPHLPDTDYRSVFKEFPNAAFVIIKMPVDKASYDNVRYNSTMLVHKAVLSAEKILYDNNVSITLSFIGGSCKLCRNGCADDQCRNPYNSRSPLEATGLNVIKTMHNHGVDIVFPVTSLMTRVGLVLWGESGK